MGGRVGLRLKQRLLKQTLNNKGVVLHSSLNDYLSTYINNKF